MTKGSGKARLRRARFALSSLPQRSSGLFPKLICRAGKMPDYKGAFSPRQKAEENKTHGAEKVAPESGSAEPRAGVTFAAQGDLFSGVPCRAGETPDCGEAPAGKTAAKAPRL